MSSELQKIESFRYALAIAETFDEIGKIDSATAAIAEFARREKISFERQNDIGKFRIEIEQKKGRWLNDNFPHGGDRGNQYTGGKLQEEKLANIDPHSSSRARLISETPIEKIVEVQEKIANRGDVITPAKVERELRKGATDRREWIPLPTEKYHVIYADPPWRYEHSVSISREIENHYPTMSIDEICELNIGSIAHDDSILFLWATNPKLSEAMKVIGSWGFVYRTNFAWVKDRIGMGYYVRQQHELLLIATKGNPGTPDPPNRPSSVFLLPREVHSKKPDHVYGMIETMYPGRKYIELFARKKREGWASYGNEVE